MICRMKRAAPIVIVDVTHHSRNCYFEAGYALGQKIPVIWTCREDDSGGTAFDVSTYPRIQWTDAADLRVRLEHRIRLLFYALD